MSDDRHMRRALDLARTALDQGELPIAAVLTLGDIVVEEGHNYVKGGANLLEHAEYRVLGAAAPRLRKVKILDRRKYWGARCCPTKRWSWRSPCRRQGPLQLNAVLGVLDLSQA